MPATRARTSATRVASNRPGNSVTIATCSGATAITPTGIGGGAPPPAGASVFLLQAHSKASVNAGRKRADLLYREFMKFSHLKKSNIVKRIIDNAKRA